VYERGVNAPIHDAATVILLRRREAGFEVFLLRRRRGASFMAEAFVFPGGGAEPGEDDRVCAARELFEESGVLLARDTGQAETLEMPSLAVLRKRVLAGTNATEALRALGLTWSVDALLPWSHWITPSVESKRFSARFFIAEMPSGMVPSFDRTETVDQAWVTPADALARTGELALPPPQVRTFWELSQHGSIDDVFSAARARAGEQHPIMPRLAQTPTGMALLLPWDPEYETAGTGDARPLAFRPRWATGPSRFVMENRAWKHVDAPGSTTAG
jgi:8-oxo-dGTP pyrophosphatase MutT (NUDIX family)